MPNNGLVADLESHIARPGSAQSTRSKRRSGVGGKDGGFVGQASWSSSVINLVNTIVGSGVLAMPLAVSHMGLFLGILIIIWSGIAAGFGLYLQTQCARYLERGTASFYAVSQITYPNTAVLFDLAIALKCFGVAVSYLIIIGNLMPAVVEGMGGDVATYSFMADRKFWITAFMLVVIPLCFLRRLDSLKYTSVVALISIAYLVVLVVAHLAKGDTIPDRGTVHIFQWQGIVPTLSSFPLVVFAYTCHQNMFPILNEIQNNSPFRTLAVVMASIGVSCSVYLLVSITGYLSFGDKVGDNIVAMYPPAVASTIGKAAIVSVVMFSYPLLVHPCRSSTDAVLKWRPIRRSETPNTSPSRLATLKGQGPRTDMSDLRFAAITTVIIILSYILAIAVSSLSAVLGYVGSTGSTSVSFILPGLFYYKISAPDSPLHQKLMKEDDDEVEETESEGTGLLGTGTIARKRWSRGIVRKLSLGLGIYGFVVMGVCLVTNTVFVASK